MKVSVNIVTRNRPTLLSRAIDSVLSQSFTDYEIVVVDNSNNDAVAEHVRQYKDKRIRLIPCHTQSRGLCYARNIGLKESKGEYMAVLDDDDVFIRKDKLEKQVLFLDNNCNFVLCGTDIVVVSPKDKVLGRKEYAHYDDEIRKSLLVTNQFCHSSVVFSRNEAIRCGGYKPVEGMWNTNEYRLWLMLGLVGKMFNFPILGTQYTYWPNAYSLGHRVKLYWHDFNMAREFRGKYPNYRQVIKRYVLVHPLRYILGMKWWQRTDHK